MKPVRGSDRAPSKAPNLKNKKKSDKATKQATEHQVRHQSKLNKSVLFCQSPVNFVFLFLGTGDQRPWQEHRPETSPEEEER